LGDRKGIWPTKHAPHIFRSSLPDKEEKEGSGLPFICKTSVKTYTAGGNN